MHFAGPDYSDHVGMEFAEIKAATSRLKSNVRRVRDAIERGASYRWCGRAPNQPAGQSSKIASCNLTPWLANSPQGGNPVGRYKSIQVCLSEPHVPPSLDRISAVDALQTYYLLPRNHVTAMIYVDHRVWLTKSAKSGKPHQDTSRRVIRARNVSQSKDRWDQRREPTDSVPLELPEFYRALFKNGVALGISPPGSAGIADAIGGIGLI